MKKGKPATRSVLEGTIRAPVSQQDHDVQAAKEADLLAARGTIEQHADRFLIHVRALSSTLACLEARQISPELLTAELARCKLDDLQLDALDSFISLNRFARFLHHMTELVGVESLGLECADFLNGSSMGVLGGALVAAPNMASAVGVLTRYMSLYADLAYVSFTVDEEKAEFSWSYSPLLVERRALCDRSARLFVSCMQYLFADDWFPLSVQLQREPPKYLAPYRQVLGRKVTFDAALNSVVFPVSDLHLENRFGNASAFELAVALAERMIKERRVPDDLSIRVREDILSHLIEGPLTAKDTSRRLGMSTRVLQRRLAALGTSYQKLCDSIRLELAQELLLQTTLPMSEIAFRLGFSNQANLTRAVKRWFGVSPRIYRQEN